MEARLLLSVSANVSRRKTTTRAAGAILARCTNATSGRPRNSCDATAFAPWRSLSEPVLPFGSNTQSPIRQCNQRLHSTSETSAYQNLRLTPELWQKNIERLLELPVGSMSRQDAAEMEGTLLSIGPVIDPTDQRRIELLWRLLDRAVGEVRERGHLEGTSKQHWWLGAMVQAWCTSSTAGPSPDEAVTRIGSYYPILTPDAKTQSTLMKAVNRKVDRKKAPFVAEAILLTLLERANDGVGRMPDVYVFNGVINIWTKSGLSEAPRKAEDILKRAHEIARSTGNSQVQPNTMMFTSVLNCWAKSRALAAPERAEAILRRMMKLHGLGWKIIKPNVMSFTAAIDCWAKSGRSEAADRAEALLYRMEKLTKSPDHGDVRPDVITINAVLNAIAVSGDPAMPERAESLLRRMPELDIMPNMTSLALVMICWVKSGRVEAAERAKAILDDMQKQAIPIDTVDLRRTTIVFTAILDTMAQSIDPRMLEQAETVLLTMPELGVMPYTRSFAKVINCWAVCHREDAGDRAMAILRHMQKLASAPDNVRLRPNVLVYNATIKCIANSSHPDAGERAISLLDEMKSSGFAKATPDEATLRAALKAASKCDIVDKEEKIRQLRREMALLGNKNLN